MLIKSCSEQQVQERGSPVDEEEQTWRGMFNCSSYLSYACWVSSLAYFLLFLFFPPVFWLDSKRDREL